VVSRVVGFKKIKFYTNENVGSGELDLPEQQMHTTSYWLALPVEVMQSLPFSGADRRDGVIGLACAMRNIAPLLETQIKYEFRPEMVSAYSAIELLKNLREANPEYKNFQYREATLNPTNPVNRAVDWESDIVDSFRNGATQAAWGSVCLAVSAPCHLF
jgi:hypothetical protein